MIIIIWSIAAIICLYSILFGITLWKQKNKAGAIAVLMMSLASMALPYFTLLK